MPCRRYSQLRTGVINIAPWRRASSFRKGNVNNGVHLAAILLCLARARFMSQGR
jgi:hypothetical protein